MASKPQTKRLWFALVLVYSCIRGGEGRAVFTTGLWFTQEPQDVVAVKNKSLVLNCTARSLPAYGRVTYSWIYQGLPLVPDSHKKVLLNGSLYIKRVKYRRKNRRTDEGIYQCLAKNSFGTIASRKIKVAIAGMSRFSFVPQSVTAEEGESVRLHCQIQGKPQPRITWRKNSNPLPQIHRYTVLDSGVLQITSVVKSDAGQYRCLATNIATDRRSSQATLTVTSYQGNTKPVEIIGSPISATKHIGDNVILECQANGLPQPVISWSKDDDPVVEDRRHKIFGQGNLLISNIRLNDAGEYVCIVTSQDGQTVEAKTTLTVQDPPKLTVLTRSCKQEVELGVMLSCVASGEPVPAVRWLKNGVAVTTNEKIQITDRGSRLSFKPSDISEDSGYYQCVAENAAGSVYGTIQLAILGPEPRPDPPFNLKASALSSTKIQVTWDHSHVTCDRNHIVGYSIHYTDPEGDELQMVVDKSQGNITGLQPYTEYKIFVKVYTQRHFSGSSETISQQTMEDVPRVAPKVKVSPTTSTSLLVTWKPLTLSQANGKVTKYVLHYREADTSTGHMDKVQGTSRQFLLTGLKPETEYEVRMLAATKVGYPVLSEHMWPWQTATTLRNSSDQVPDPPFFEVKAVSDVMLMVTWRVTGGNPVTGYRLEYQKDSDDPHTVELLPSLSSYIISGLEASTLYRVSLKGYNDKGWGMASVREAKTLPKGEGEPNLELMPQPPLDVDCEQVSSESVSLNWSALSNNSQIVKYTVCVNEFHHQEAAACNSSQARLIPSMTEHVSVDQLKPFTEYTFSVRSHTKHNHGVFSSQIKCMTLEGVPSEPTNLRSELLGPRSVEVKWQPPEKRNGNIIFYTILYSRDMQMDRWAKKQENGTETMTQLQNLEMDSLYYIKMQAATRAGLGRSSSVIRVYTTGPVTTTPLPSINNNQELGIIIGVCIGGCCIIICIIILLFRNRCFSPRSDHQPMPHNGSMCTTPPNIKGNGHLMGEHIRASDIGELEIVAPMLPHIQENENSDSKGGYNSYKLGNGGLHMTPRNGLQAVQLSDGQVQTLLCPPPEYCEIEDSNVPQVAMQTFHLHSDTPGPEDHTQNDEEEESFTSQPTPSDSAADQSTATPDGHSPSHSKLSNDTCSQVTTPDSSHKQKTSACSDEGTLSPSCHTSSTSSFLDTDSWPYRSETAWQQHLTGSPANDNSPLLDASSPLSRSQVSGQLQDSVTVLPQRT